MTQAPIRIILGSGEDCDFTIADPSISQRHVAVTLGRDPLRAHIEDLDSTNGTWVAGKRIQRAEISTLDIIQLGQRPVSIRHLVQQFHPSPSTGSGVLVVGRNQTADIVLPLPMISGQHLKIRSHNGRFEVMDVNSTNGTHVNGIAASDWTPLSADDGLQMGSFRVPPIMLQDWLTKLALMTDIPPQAVTLPTEGRITLGRDPESDVHLDHPQVSWNHATIAVSGSRWLLSDLNSANGTMVDGTPISQVEIDASSPVHLGDIPLRLLSAAQPQSTSVETVRLDAIGLTRQLSQGPLAGRVILDDISVSIYPGELVALMGPSGAGKTTLLEILTGQRPPEGGHVLFNGHNLHQTPQLRSYIGYVPQEDIMHRDLTVFEVLFHAAQMRLPPHLSREDVVEHVEKLITRMGLAHIRDNIIGGEAVRGVSGGQRKRVNIALALITEPPLLFLDEPTSGLDATSTMEVLMVLRQLADAGKTIIMTIHQPRIEAFSQVDQLLLLAKGGKLAYFGPAADAGNYFSARTALPLLPQSNPADYVIDALDPANPEHLRSPDSWKNDYRESPVYLSHVQNRLGPNRATAATVLPSSKPTRGGWLQLQTLFRRYAIRKGRDRTSLGIQLLQPLIIGSLLAMLYSGADEVLPADTDTLEEWHCMMHPDDEVMGEDGETSPCTPPPPPNMPNATQWASAEPPQNHPATLRGFHAGLFLLAAAAFWLGCSNVARELVADRPVYLRERRSGLHRTSYLASVFLLQLLVAMVQIAIMGGLVWVGLSLHTTNPLAFGGVLLATAGVGVSLGLAVSAWARTEVTAISVIPILLLPQLMLAGFIKLYMNMPDMLQFGSALIPVRWAFQGLIGVEYDAWEDSLVGSASALSFHIQDVVGFPASTYMLNISWLLLMTVVFLGVAHGLLVKED